MSDTTWRVLVVGMLLGAVSFVIGFFTILAFKHERVWPGAAPAQPWSERQNEWPW